MIKLPHPFHTARREAKKSTMRPQVGAVIVLDKQRFTGYNKFKTDPKFANPAKTEKMSVHAELDCLGRGVSFSGGELYVYREIGGVPAMARPCNHCLKFIKEAGIERIFYTIPHEPFYEKEEI